MATSANDDILKIPAPSELDFATAPSLKAEMTPIPRGRSVALDMSETTFIDAAGVGGVIELRNAVLAAGGSFQLVAVAPRPARVLNLVRLGWLLPMLSI